MQFPTIITQASLQSCPDQSLRCLLSAALKQCAEMLPWVGMPRCTPLAPLLFCKLSTHIGTATGRLPLRHLVFLPPPGVSASAPGPLSSLSAAADSAATSAAMMSAAADW